MSSITEAEIAARVEQICAQASAVWLGQSLNGSGHDGAGSGARDTASAVYGCHDEEAALDV